MEKFVLRSRALWGMLLPGLAVMAQQTGIGEDVFGQARGAVEGLLGAAGAAMWLWHHFRPDPRTPVLRVPPAAGGVVITMLALGGPLWLSGCAGNPNAQMTPAQCRKLMAVAKLGIAECARLEDAEKVAKCEHYATAAIEVATAACGFIPEGETDDG